MHWRILASKVRSRLLANRLLTCSSPVRNPARAWARTSSSMLAELPPGNRRSEAMMISNWLLPGAFALISGWATSGSPRGGLRGACGRSAAPCAQGGEQQPPGTVQPVGADIDHAGTAIGVQSQRDPSPDVVLPRSVVFGLPGAFGRHQFHRVAERAGGGKQ